MYTFRLRAVKGTGSAKTGGTPTDATPVAPPDAVASVSVTRNGSTLSVSWGAVTGAATYDVEYQESGATAWNSAASAQTGTSLTISSVDSTKRYTVRVKAKNAGGASSWTTSQSASVPAAPDAVDTTTISVTHNGASLSVSWTGPARATHFDVTYYAVGQDHARAAWNRAGTSLTVTYDIRESYENQNCVSGGAAYAVGIRARNAGGESGWAYSTTATSVSNRAESANGGIALGGEVPTGFRTGGSSSVRYRLASVALENDCSGGIPSGVQVHLADTSGVNPGPGSPVSTGSRTRTGYSTVT